MELTEIQKILRVIPDFPKAGINFVDVNPLLTHVNARQAVLKHLVEQYKGNITINDDFCLLEFKKKIMERDH